MLRQKGIHAKERLGLMGLLSIIKENIVPENFNVRKLKGIYLLLLNNRSIRLNNLKKRMFFLLRNWGISPQRKVVKC